MIPSVEWARKYKLKVVRIEHLYKDFLKTKCRELANKHIVDPIVETMRANGIHRKIYESVIVKDIIVDEHGVKITINSEYFSEGGFDVALAREKGTEDHMIRPKTAGSLRWMGPNGKFLFSKGHMVSGLPPLNLIERGVEKGEYELQQALNIEARKWIQDILK